MHEWRTHANVGSYAHSPGGVVTAITLSEQSAQRPGGRVIKGTSVDNINPTLIQVCQILAEAARREGLLRDGVSKHNPLRVYARHFCEQWLN